MGKQNAGYWRYRRSWLPFHPALIVGDVFRIQQLVGRGVFAQPVLGRGAGVHEGLSDYRQAGVGDAALVDVEHKLRVLYDVHPEPEGKTVGDAERTRQCNVPVS